jgi:hypothetical protein
MYKQFTLTIELVQTEIKALQQVQLQTKQLDKQFSAQFNSVLLLKSSLSNSED